MLVYQTLAMGTAVGGHSAMEFLEGLPPIFVFALVAIRTLAEGNLELLCLVVF